MLYYPPAAPPHPHPISTGSRTPSPLDRALLCSSCRPTDQDRAPLQLRPSGRAVVGTAGDERFEEAQIHHCPAPSKLPSSPAVQEERGVPSTSCGLLLFSARRGRQGTWGIDTHLQLTFSYFWFVAGDPDSFHVSSLQFTVLLFFLHATPIHSTLAAWPELLRRSPPPLHPVSLQFAPVVDDDALAGGGCSAAGQRM